MIAFDETIGKHQDGQKMPPMMRSNCIAKLLDITFHPITSSRLSNGWDGGHLSGEAPACDQLEAKCSKTASIIILVGGA